MKIMVNPTWGSYDRRTAQLFTVYDPITEFSVQISDFGATLVQVKVPDRDGVADKVTYTVSSPAELAEPNSFWGATIGRVANRIGNGKFTLDGQAYSLFRNNGTHTLHGGEHGWNHRFFEFLSAEVTGDKAELCFGYISPDGEEGYPGQVTLLVKYTVEPMKIGWDYKATTDKTTIINVTNHAFWNLDGISSTIHDQVIRLAADQVIPVDSTCLATGQLVPVDEANVDMRSPRTFRDVLETFGDVDNSFVLSGYGKATGEDKTFFCAEVFSPKTGRAMEIFTTEPQVQLYTGNFMQFAQPFGKPSVKHAAFCLETQRAPDAINHEHLRDQVVLRPGETYRHSTRHVFSVRK
eukprot:TRINITY_DN536_c0_g3_i1.p3 TRINITY_DN536_c0_g3~~TRINITY_DN536_c0_g3_i1.p3  ORF type:complete len:351 (+),score=125.04 TRINITY_DN536_c0_g3_i1:1388-2440(+)